MKKKGFTLVELVITIAIVLILSVVSVPIYRGYINKAKWAEAYALSGTILSAQKAYYSEHGNFLVKYIVTSYSTELGVDARGNKYFTWFYVDGSWGDPKFLFDAGLRMPTELRESGHKKKFYFNYKLPGASGTTEYGMRFSEDDNVF